VSVSPDLADDAKRDLMDSEAMCPSSRSVT
jgi:hypothetical protein